MKKCVLLAGPFILLLLIWVLFLPRTSTGSSNQSLITEEGRALLGKSLASLAFRNRTVILTTLNQAWAKDGGMFDLFLRSFNLGIGTKELLNHLLVITMDQQSYQRCQLVHGHCYNMFKLDASGGSHLGSMEFRTPDYLQLMWRRLDLLREVLELGYSFVQTDVDIMWLRDPFPHFHPDADFEGATDDGKDGLNNGFVHAVSNERTVEMYKLWYKSRLKRPDLVEQVMFQYYLRFTPEFRRIGLKIKFLDGTRFTGFCMLDTELDQVCTVHANCCTGLDRKMVDLRLVLDDWVTYKADQGSRRRTSRAPSKCLHSWCDDPLVSQGMTDLQKTYFLHWCRYIKAELTILS